MSGSSRTTVNVISVYVLKLYTRVQRPHAPKAIYRRKFSLFTVAKKIKFSQ